MEQKLNDKQKGFCKEYIKDKNAEQAAIRAGYLPEIGAILLSKIAIQHEINRLINEDSNIPVYDVKPETRKSYEFDAVVEEVCRRIALGESLATICKDAHIPSITMVLRWLHDGEKEGADSQLKAFVDNYVRAREVQADTFAEQIADIADEMPKRVNTAYGTTTDSAWVAHQRNRIDARKWVAGKLKPKKYGDRQILAGDKDNPLETNFEIKVTYVRPSDTGLSTT